MCSHVGVLLKAATIMVDLKNTKSCTEDKCSWLNPYKKPVSNVIKQCTQSITVIIIFLNTGMLCAVVGMWRCLQASLHQDPFIQISYSS